MKTGKMDVITPAEGGGDNKIHFTAFVEWLYYYSTIMFHIMVFIF